MTSQGHRRRQKNVDAIYQLPLLAHAAMEPMNCTVHVRSDACDVWVGTQVLTRARATAADVTGLPLEKVKVYNHLLGGGFGRRLDIDGMIWAVKIARQVEFPVKVVWTREEDIQHDLYRPYYYDRLSAGLDDKGMPIAWTDRVTAPRSWPAGRRRCSKTASIWTLSTARRPALRFSQCSCRLCSPGPPPGIQTAWWRGVGMTHNIFVVEGFVDELAAAARKDPVEYRRALLDKIAARQELCLNSSPKRLAGPKRLPNGKGRGMSVQHVFGTYLSQVAEVAVAKDG